MITKEKEKRKVRLFTTNEKKELSTADIDGCLICDLEFALDKDAEITINVEHGYKGYLVIENEK